MNRLRGRPPGRNAQTRPMLGAIVATLLAAALLAPAAAAQPPTSSGSVSRYTDTFAVAYFDAEDGLLALAGPAPEEGCFGLGFDDPAQFTEVQTEAGPIVLVIHQAEIPVAVYDATLGHPCEILFAGGTPTPLYVGTIRTVSTDNDLDVSLTRTNSFGASSTGWVEDPGGDRCQFSAHVRLQVNRQGEFRVLSEGITISC